MTHSTFQPHISSESTVNDVLLRYPESVSVFNAFGIDACCGGDVSLAVAAARDSVALGDLLAGLDAAAAAALHRRTRTQ